MKLEAFTEFSTATLRAPDIAHGLLVAARQLFSAATIADLESIIESQDETVDAHEGIIAAMEELQEHCPLYCFVGSHIGDHACIGVWPHVESMLEDTDILHLTDLCEIPEGHEGLVSVTNDHGNVTLYECIDGHHIELWACV